MARQRTIKNSVEIEGVGLQTGKRVKLSLKRSPANSGINFIRLDLPNKPLLNVLTASPGHSHSKERRTTLRMEEVEIQTTEHLLAALAGLSIDNIVIEIDGVELPGLDGSARDFVEAIKKADIIEEDAQRVFLKPTEAVWSQDGSAVLAAFPDEGFRVSYTLSYPGIGTQFLSLVIDEANFEKEIAPARTFCSEAEALELLKRGLGKGSSCDNTLVIGREGPLKTSLRFPDEPVRHKILDLVGDLYLVGMPIKAHVVAIKSGHKLNMELVRRLKQLV